MFGEKLQIPTSNLQRNFKLQAPISAHAQYWRLGAWCFSGCWRLEFRAFLDCVTGPDWFALGMTRFRPALVLAALVICRLFPHSALAHPAEEMSIAAKNFVGALTPDQRTKAVIEFKSDERFNWHYIPRERKGLPFKEMSAPQRQLAQGILLSALSAQGYTKTTNIIFTVEQ